MYASLFQGQVTDARMVASEWRPAEEMALEGHVSDASSSPTAPHTDEYDDWQLVLQVDPSPRCYTILTAQSVKEVHSGVYVYDMGQNFAGIPSIKLSGRASDQTLRFRYAEVLYPSLPEYKGNENILTFSEALYDDAEGTKKSHRDAVEGKFHRESLSITTSVMKPRRSA